MADGILSSPDLALKIRCKDYYIRRLARRGLIPYQRAGRTYVFHVSDIPLIREALINSGYLSRSDEPAVDGDTR